MQGESVSIRLPLDVVEIVLLSIQCILVIAVEGVTGGFPVVLGSERMKVGICWQGALGSGKP